MATTATKTAADKGTGAIADHRISDLATFQEVTKKPREVAGLYFYMELDCLVDLAYRISCDFFKRPHLYTELGRVTVGGRGSSMSGILARLNARYGSNEKIPSKEQRKQIYEHIFGQAEGNPPTSQGDFPRLRDELISAATAFAERVFDTGEDMLRERVRTTHRPFKEYLIGLHGDSVRWSKDEALSDITENVGYAILRSRGIAAVFGISNPPRTEWPYFEDSNADKVIEQISKQLVWGDEPAISLTREHFSNMQRVALRGAEALATIIDFDERITDEPNKENLKTLIIKCYTWGSALKSIKPYV